MIPRQVKEEHADDVFTQLCLYGHMMTEDRPIDIMSHECRMQSQRRRKSRFILESEKTGVVGISGRGGNV